MIKIAVRIVDKTIYQRISNKEVKLFAVVPENLSIKYYHLAKETIPKGSSAWVEMRIW